MAADTDTSKTVTLTDNDTGNSVTLPVIDGTVGPDVLDIRKLYGQTGMFTFDPGYGATGSCMSGLTYIDGDEGVLLHRGYEIEELANKSNFLELAYLLLEGELPNAEQKSAFDEAITRHTGAAEAAVPAVAPRRRGVPDRGQGARRARRRLPLLAAARPGHATA